MGNTDLRSSTKQVFDECSPIYLREDKHWGCDLDIISEYVENFNDPEVIELGTGYAWHLANLFFLTSVNFKRVVGIDYSDGMLEKAKVLLSSLSCKGCPLTEKIELQKEDILSLPFENGSFDVALLLNNTLGNISASTFDKAKEQRKEALREIRRILKISGFLILSVYNSRELNEKDKYGKFFKVDQKLSNLENFDLVIRFVKTGTLYYSHWFNRNEILHLLNDVNLEIVEVEERKKRIVVVVQKKQGKKRNFDEK